MVRSLNLAVSLAAACMVADWGRASADVIFDEVVSMATSNHVETWEGTYSLTNVVEFASNGTDRIFACLYVCDEKGYSRADGRTIVDVYSGNSRCIKRIHAADTNIKGVTPVLQRIGIATNYPFAAYWMLWRHPGNGGLQKYTEYAFTNGCFSLVRHLEFGDVKPNRRWYLVENEDAYSASICPIVSDFHWYDNETIWENTNTIYRSYIGWP